MSISYAIFCNMFAILSKYCVILFKCDYVKQLCCLVKRLRITIYATLSNERVVLSCGVVVT